MLTDYCQPFFTSFLLIAQTDAACDKQALDQKKCDLFAAFAMRSFHVNQFYFAPLQIVS